MFSLGPELLLAALVVTSLATGGLLGLWAATSERHWFVRTLMVFAVLTPLLDRPIYEPFVTLLVEVATVVLGVTIWRRNWPTFRFSIAGLLMLTVLVAILVASVMRAPEIGLASWLQIVGMGITAGGAILLAAWLVRGKWRLRYRAPVALLIAMGLTFAGTACDYLSETFVQFDDQAFLTGTHTPFEMWLRRLAGAAIRLVAVVAIAMLLLPAVLGPRGEGVNGRWAESLARITVFALAALPAWVVWELSNPLAIPDQPPVASPAYTRLMELAESPQFAAILAAYSPDPINMVAMRTAIRSAAAELAEARVLLNKTITLPVSFSAFEPLPMDDIQKRREFAWVLQSQAMVARENEDSAMAFDACESLIQYVAQTQGQGLVIGLIVTSGIESIAYSETDDSLDLFNAKQSKALARKLMEFNSPRSSIETAFHYDHIFCENAYGWSGHLQVVLDDWSNADQRWYWAGGKEWLLRIRNETVGNLLATRLALHAYQLENHAYPKSLAELVPNYLPHIPADPCSDTGQPLIYRRTADGYQLYSRGYDGDDDGGRPCNVDEYGGIDWTTDGDLSLEAYFADE